MRCYAKLNTYSVRIRALSEQAGQSMLLGLVLCGAGVVAWLLMLQLGQRVHDQSSLHRAADAASYSAAIIQARALNMHAYLNRAQLAHQIAMAHLIGAATAAQFRAKLGQQARRRNPPPSLIGAFFGPQYSAAYVAALSGGFENQFSLQTFRHAFLRHERLIHHVLDRVRNEQIHQLENRREDVLQRVLVRNIGHNGSSMRGDSLKELGLTTKFTLNESKGFVVQHSASDATWRNFLTTLVGQYGFLAERNKTQRNFWMINVRCPHKRHELRRRGRLEIGTDGQWHSEESLSFHALRHNKLIGCYHREYPMGWAVVETHAEQSIQPESAGATMDFNRRPFWRWARAQGGEFWNIFGGRENPLAQSWGKSAMIRWSSKGLGRYAQIANGRQHSPIRFALTVKQRLPSDATITSESTSQTYFEPPIQSQHNKFSRHYRIEQRPARAISSSLFEPYWRATLIPNLHSINALKTESNLTSRGSGR